MTMTDTRRVAGAADLRPITVGVCGFPRCGSSMTMRMLHLGGVRPVDGSMGGSYELPNLIELVDLHGVELTRRSVKLLDTFLVAPTIARRARWKFIWLDRNPREQAKSMAKFFTSTAPGAILAAGLLDVDERKLQRSFRADRPRALAELRGRGDVLVTSFEKILESPISVAADIRTFLAPLQFDPACAAAAVNPRPPECAPDVAHELSTLSDGNPT